MFLLRLASTTVWNELEAVSGNSLRHPGRAGGEPSTSSTPCQCSVEIYGEASTCPFLFTSSRNPFHLHVKGWLSFQVVSRGATRVNTFWNAELSSVPPPSPWYRVCVTPLKQPKYRNLSPLETDLTFIFPSWRWYLCLELDGWYKNEQNLKTSTWRSVSMNINFTRWACNLLTWWGTRPQESVCICWSRGHKQKPGTYHKNLKDTWLFQMMFQFQNPEILLNDLEKLTVLPLGKVKTSSVWPQVCWEIDQFLF